VRAIRAVIPTTMPLMVRISATEWMEWSGKPSWDLAQSKQLAAVLAGSGDVDLLDVSSGGNNPAQQIKVHPYFQADMAGEIRAELQRLGKKALAIGAVGMISNAEMARSVVQADGKVEGTNDDGKVEVEGESGTKTRADLVLVARQFLREPEFVLKTAFELGVKVQGPIQYHRAPYRKERL
jgi:2,4-dienoyl-CoA reductase-like NADH-dependent reductase (Old Yellow Enzyme family)